MPDILGILLSHGSIVLVVAVIIAAGLGLPIPEDIPLLVAGVLVHRGEVTYVGALAACAAAVLIGDTSIFLLARHLGPSALERRPLSWLITPERRQRIEELFTKHGNVIVFVARHMAGLRAPTFAMAGMHGMPIMKFWLWDGLGLCISAPVVIGIGYLLADKLGDAQAMLHRVETFIIGGLVLIVIGVVVWHRRRKPVSVQEH